MPIPKSTLLCTTYIRYLSHYRSSTWSMVPSFPPQIQQDQIDHRPLLDFHCVSPGFSCSFLSESASVRPAPSSKARHSDSSTITSCEKEICLKFIGALNILLTPLMLECLTTYIDRWKTYEPHVMSILDALHFHTITQAHSPTVSSDLSATKLSVVLPKVNLCFLQAGLAEDNVQLTDLRTPMDIVTMSLFALACKNLQMETIVSRRDQATAAVFKIQSIIGQFRRFDNEFSCMDQVNIHAIQSDRCRLQIHLPDGLKTHLPLGVDRANFGFVMNEFGVQRLSLRFINHIADQQRRSSARATVVQVDERQTSTKRQPSMPLSPLPVSSSSIVDASIDQVWISFPEPPSHTTAKKQTVHSSSSQKSSLSYTRYDWNFLSTLSSTVFGWVSVVDRTRTSLTDLLQLREKRLDAVLAYFLVETTPVSSIPPSHFNELFSANATFLRGHPVCQLIGELRKQFNSQLHIVDADLYTGNIPETRVLQQGIRQLCQGWSRTFPRRPIQVKHTAAGHAKQQAPNAAEKHERDEGDASASATAPSGIRRFLSTQYPRRNTSIEMYPIRSTDDRRSSASFLGNISLPSFDRE